MCPRAPRVGARVCALRVVVSCFDCVIGLGIALSVLAILWSRFWCVNQKNMPVIGFGGVSPLTLQALGCVREFNPFCLQMLLSMVKPRRFFLTKLL